MPPTSRNEEIANCLWLQTRSNDSVLGIAHIKAALDEKDVEAEALRGEIAELLDEPKKICPICSYHAWVPIGNPPWKEADYMCGICSERRLNEMHRAVILSLTEALEQVKAKCEQDIEDGCLTVFTVKPCFCFVATALAQSKGEYNG